MEGYERPMPPDREDRLRRWHDGASAALHALGDHDVDYLGLTLHVPAGVFPPAPMSQLPGRAVTDQVSPGDRVLDMGTGSGVNAILAAQEGATVVALGSTRQPSLQPGATLSALVSQKRVDVRAGDLFDEVEGRFDVVVYDPTFRWLPPADMLERAFTDTGYETLERFFAEVGEHLAPDGRLLMFLGTTGDIDHFYHLAADHGLDVEVLDSAEFNKDGLSRPIRRFDSARAIAASFSGTGPPQSSPARARCTDRR